MTPDRLDIIRKSWKPWRGRVDWRHHRSGFMINLRPDEIDLSQWSVPIEDKTESLKFTAEDCGYYHQGQAWEWWNIICEGHIIDAERFESRHQRFASQNVF